MYRNHRAATLAAVAITGALLATGCSSSSGGKKSEEGGAAASTGKADTPRMTVAMITHAAPGDTFWDLIRKGAEAAAAKDNIELVYSSDPDAGNQANLVQNAIARRSTASPSPLAKPDAMKDAVAKASAAGIPVVGFNAGLDDWKKLGMQEYFGQDENIAGQAVGERLNESGAKNVVCVIQEQGQVALESRCAGVKKGFSGKTEILNVNGTDMPSVESTITAKLQQDPSIDDVVTLGAPFALTAVQSVSDADSKAKIATFDLNKDLVDGRPGRQRPVGGRPAALPAGLPRRRRSVAVQEQRQLHRRRHRTRPHRPGVHHQGQHRRRGRVRREGHSVIRS